MLPSHLAENIRQQVLYWLQSTFDFGDKGVERAFERFLEDPEEDVNAAVKDQQREDKTIHDYPLVRLSDDELYRAGVPHPLIPAA